MKRHEGPTADRRSPRSKIRNGLSENNRRVRVAGHACAQEDIEFLDQEYARLEEEESVLSKRKHMNRRLRDRLQRVLSVGQNSIVFQDEGYGSKDQWTAPSTTLTRSLTTSFSFSEQSGDDLPQLASAARGTRVRSSPPPIECSEEYAPFFPSCPTPPECAESKTQMSFASDQQAAQRRSSPSLLTLEEQAAFNATNESIDDHASQHGENLISSETDMVKTCRLPSSSPPRLPPTESILISTQAHRGLPSLSQGYNSNNSSYSDAGSSAGPKKPFYAF